MNIYQFELTAKCPNGTLEDRYDCEVRSAGIIHVERLNEMRNRIKSAKLFQEDIADNIRNELQASVTLTGWHYGVKIICERQ